MKTVIKFELETENSPNLTNHEMLELAKLFNGRVSQVACVNNICRECESLHAGQDYCDGCKATKYSQLAL